VRVTFGGIICLATLNILLRKTVEFTFDCCFLAPCELALGNGAKSNLKEIWKGKAYEEFREKMATDRYLTEFCRKRLSIYYTE